MISRRRPVRVPVADAADVERDAIVDHLRVGIHGLLTRGYLAADPDLIARRLDALLDGVTGGLHR